MSTPRKCGDAEVIDAVGQVLLPGLVLGVLALAWLARVRDRLPARFALMALGVLFFELFTAPMWNNAHLGRWAYPTAM